MKTQPTDQAVLEFLESVESEQRRKDGLELLRIFQEATGQPAVMWGSSIVGFGKYHYMYESGHEGDMCAVGFSPRKAKLSVYILEGSEDDPSDEMLVPLGKFKRTKACIYINSLDDIDQDFLRTLIKQSYENTLKKWTT